MTKYHTLGGLNSRNIVSQSSGGWKSEIRVWAGLVPSEAVRESYVPGLSPWPAGIWPCFPCVSSHHPPSRQTVCLCVHFSFL